MVEFRPFSEIKKLTTVRFAITQKIHGSNAQILVFQTENGELDLRCGSRSKWVFPGKDTDNYGFAGFVHEHKSEFIEKLGLGRHDGEWAGPGINSGEGLKQKTFVLFNHWAWPEDRPLPPSTVVVPVLYEGQPDMTEIDRAMADLKQNGSRLAPGFMRPEGVVIEIAGSRYKQVFAKEETAWDKGSKGPKPPRGAAVDYNYLCQPVRLEKLLSRDEAYLRDYPKTLPLIVKDYVADLTKESQIPGDVDEQAAHRKNASSQIFKFVKAIIEEKHLVSSGN